MKANKTVGNGKRVWAWIAIGLKLFADFFTLFSTRFAAWTKPGSLAQDAHQDEEARMREVEHQARIAEDERRERDDREARIWNDERQAQIQEAEGRNHDAAMRLAREKQKTLSPAEIARLGREYELQRRRRDLGHGGPGIKM